MLETQTGKEIKAELFSAKGLVYLKPWRGYQKDSDLLDARTQLRLWVCQQWSVGEPHPRSTSRDENDNGYQNKEKILAKRSKKSGLQRGAKRPRVGEGGGGFSFWADLLISQGSGHALEVEVASQIERQKTGCF